MSVSRYSVVLAVIAALVIGFLLGSATPPANAAQFSPICPLVDRSGKPLATQDANANGDIRCWYGGAHDPLYPCEDSSVPNAVLQRIGKNKFGQTKCVYRTIIVRPTMTPLTPPTPTPTPELTSEPTP